LAGSVGVATSNVASGGSGSPSAGSGGGNAGASNDSSGASGAFGSSPTFGSAASNSASGTTASRAGCGACGWARAGTPGAHAAIATAIQIAFKRNPFFAPTRGARDSSGPGTITMARLS
jgi:hypothetical protein